MESATINALHERGITSIGIVSLSVGDNWDHLVPQGVDVSITGYGVEFNPVSLCRFVIAASRHGYVYVLGADVVDGVYGDRASLRRIALASLAATAGTATSIVSFSISEKPSKVVLNYLARLPQSIRLCARDGVSKARLQRYLIRDVVTSADPAFLLRPDFNSPVVRKCSQWMDREKKAKRVLLGLNLNPITAKCIAGATEELLMQALKSTISELVSLEQPVSVALVSHDFRGPASDFTLAQTVLCGLEPHIRSHCLLVPKCSASEIKAIVAEMDFVLSCRMHLAIACLSQKTPVGCVPYQGKFEGLYQFFDLDGLTLEPEDLINPQILTTFLVSAVENRSAFRGQIEKRLSSVVDLANTNFI